ncbi:MAG: putative peptide zinc metalloprotease protein [Oleiphilaceae bacterium]|jgi:putative peptide zinc metalloprotease protein
MQVDPQAWDAIAQLKPQLRSHACFHQHRYRGRTWHILAGTLSSGYFRCTEQVFQFIQRLDGTQTIAEIYQYLLDAGDDTSAPYVLPDKADILKVIATLQNKDLLQGDIPISGSDLYDRYQKQATQAKVRVWSRPLSFKLSVWDPNTWLEKQTPKLSWLFKRWVLLVTISLIIVGSLLTFGHWFALTEHFSVRFMSPQNLLLIWLIYPLVKLFHELGHAISAKHWGGEIHDMGLMFIVFMPVPYVDASSSYQFSDKHHRMMVAAAGIFIELLLAALGVVLWTILEDGLVRDIAFNIAVVGGLSTLFINGNPLLRFDGYYVFSDAIEIPNLAGRSTQYLGYLGQKIIFGRKNMTSASISPITAEGERSWLVFYGIAALLYRIFISFMIAFYVASHYFVVGMMLAFLSLMQQIIWPLLTLIKSTVMLAQAYQSLRRLAFVSTIFGLVLAFVFCFPIHSSTHIEGIISLPEEATVRAQNNGFMRQVSKSNGEQVKVGDRLFVLENTDLKAKKILITLQLAQLKARASAAFMNDALSSDIIKIEIQQTQEALANVEQKLAKLKVNSLVEGVFSGVNTLDMPGRFYRKGEVLGYVITLSNISVNAIIPQNKLNQLNNRDASDWQVKLNSQPASTFMATIGREVPRASYQLPSAKLGSSKGGSIRVDARDAEGLTALGAVYQLELKLPQYQEPYLAAKVEIKMQHQAESLGHYALWQVRRFLSENFQY